MNAPRQAVTPKNENLIAGFILSREVMDCTEATLKDYRSRLHQFRRFVEATYPGISFPETTRQHIESYLVDLRNAGRAGYTLKTQYRALCAFYRWMIEEQFITESPLRHIKSPKVPKRGKEFLSVAQRDRLLEYCPLSTFLGARNAAIIWLLWTTGMRLSELTGLQLVDLEADNERIKVFGKGRRERYVEYTKEAKKAIWRYMAYRNDTFPALWLTEERRPLQRDGARIALERVYRRADIKVKDRAHIFRRSWAMRKISEGVPTKFIQITGGWLDIKTLDIYVQAINSEQALKAMKGGGR